MIEDKNISEKVRQYLDRKLNDCTYKLIKLKRKRKIVKILYVTTVMSSITISAAVVTLTSIISAPIIAITTLSAGSAILTGVSARFNFQNKKIEINNLIDKLNKIQSKLDM